ncbi:MAG: electron transfer flavoprotein subunit beta/FixA family protein [Clostridia bacterium]
MNIVVCIKQVPDTSEVKIDKKTNNLLREGVPSILNPFDKCGIEEALKIKDIFGGKVIVITMGPPQAAGVLEYAMGMGADESILLSDRFLGGSDTLATGYALSEVIRKIKFDLIICGSEAVDGCTGQVGPIIAENLDIPQLTYVRKIDVNNDYISVYRETRAGFDMLKAKLPALVCVIKGINEPRESVSTHKKATVYTAEDAGLDMDKIGISGSPTRVAEIRMSDVRAKSYVSIDSSLSAEERIKAIINGGLTIRKKVNLLRGTAEEMASAIFTDPDFKRFLEV